jgi:hypothetical protein
MTFNFSQAARLYAQNAEIVNAMREEFEKEELRFYSEVEEHVRKRIAKPGDPRRFHVKPTPGYRTWWIGEEPATYSTHPRQYVQTGRESIVVPGKVTVFVQAQYKDPPTFKSRVAAIRHAPNLPAGLVTGPSPDNYAQFTYVVDVGGPEGIERLAEAVAWMAQAILAEYLNFQGSQPAPPT